MKKSYPPQIKTKLISMNENINLQRIKKEFNNIPNLEILDTDSDRKRFSKDFFNYSPLLIKRLHNCLADIVVRPSAISAVKAVTRACKKYSIPLTIRGSGTGNYGQCVPINGGVVMIMSEIKKIRSFDNKNGQVTVETGCLIKDLDIYLREFGRQLRLLPSTWRSASVGGFIAGGSGGIGSARWGFLRDPGHLLGIEVVTAENHPQRLQLDASSAEALNHAYGTNGIITAMTIATTAAVEWHEVIIDCSVWSDAVELVQQISRAAVETFLCCLLEKEVVSEIPEWCGSFSGRHRILMLVAPDGLSTVNQLAKKMGADFKNLGPENFQSGSGLRELTWNHTTLHMRGVDPNWTYLQMLLPHPELEAMSNLKREWKNDLLWHLEVVRQNGAQRLAALPLVRWRDEPTLIRLIDQCKKIGAIIFNPHVITVEDGGLGVVDADQVDAKRRFDPGGILNPGKLKGWL